MMHTIVLLRSVAAFEDEGLEYLDLWRVLGDKKVLDYKWDFIYKFFGDNGIADKTLSD